MSDEPTSSSARSSSRRPAARRLTRREFILTGAAAAVGTTAIGLGLYGVFEGSGHHAAVPDGFHRIDLPQIIRQNPVYMAKSHEGGLVLFVLRKNGSPLAYLVNGNGRMVWELCDGTRTREEVCATFAKQTGRSESEANRFLTSLLARGLVIQGGYVIASADFPSSIGPSQFKAVG